MCVKNPGAEPELGTRLWVKLKLQAVTGDRHDGAPSPHTLLLRVDTVQQTEAAFEHRGTDSLSTHTVSMFKSNLCYRTTS